MSDISIGAPPAVDSILRPGSVLAKTFWVFGRHSWKFLVLAFPSIILEQSYTVFLFPQLRSALNPWIFIFSDVLAGIPQSALGIIAEGMIAYGAFQAIRGQPFTIGQSMALGVSRLLPVVGIAISSSLMMAVGTILFFVPGVIVSCMLYVAIPASVIEKRGVIASLGRSAALTKGNRWAIFALILVVAAVTLVVILPTLFIPLGELGLVPPVLRFVFLVVSSAFGAILSVAVYHDLCAAKEGFDADNLTAVFD
jgi:hypothetical protein